MFLKYKGQFKVLRILKIEHDIEKFPTFAFNLKITIA